MDEKVVYRKGFSVEKGPFDIRFRSVLGSILKYSKKKIEVVTNKLDLYNGFDTRCEIESAIDRKVKVSVYTPLENKNYIMNWFVWNNTNLRVVQEKPKKQFIISDGNYSLIYSGAYGSYSGYTTASQRKIDFLYRQLDKLKDKSIKWKPSGKDPLEEFLKESRQRKTGLPENFKIKTG